MGSSRITLDTVIYVDEKPTTVVPAGKAYKIKYVADNLEMSGPFSVMWKLYSDGVLVWSQKGPLITKSGMYERKFVKPYFPPGDTKLGPFYLCASAISPSGQTSYGAPCTAVLWIGIEVPLQRVSNGCGGQLGSKYIDKWMQKSWDSHVFQSKSVSFKPACDVHDAGYSGVTIYDPFVKEVVDYRTTSRFQIDEYFKMNLQTICLAQPPEIVSECFFYPGKYYTTVRTIGMWFYDADPTKPNKPMPQRKYVAVKGRTDAPLGVGRPNT
jgi:hypothetical protein